MKRQFDTSYARTDFGLPPPGYIPGAGRGAIGFTTTADYVTASDIITGDDDRGLLGSLQGYDEEDEEADEVWEKVSNRMDERRKRRREEKAKVKLEDYRRKKPKISADFKDCKEELKKMNPDDWYKIEEGVDRSQKRRKFVRYTPVPDNIILSGVSGSSEKNKHFNALNEARDINVKTSLKKISDSITGQTNVDPKSYITGLDTQIIMKENDITDRKKAVEIFRSMKSTNPDKPSVYIGCARIEELSGKLSKARNILLEGCEKCPNDEDIWLEAARVHSKDMAKSILCEAIKHLPLSENIWIKAIDLENNVKGKKKVLKRALEIIPKSVTLWKEAIEMEDEDGARIMLAKAVEFIPENVDLWLALARLESYEQAKRVLNSARKKNPTEPLIWITAALLEESKGDKKRIDLIIRKAISSLKQHKVSIKRKQWIEYAYQCEESEHNITCQHIINHTIDIGLEKDEYKEQWKKDINEAGNTKHFVTARAICFHGCKIFAQKKSFWKIGFDLERKIGSYQSTVEILERGVKFCTKEELWLLLAKLKWDNGDVEGARDVLTRAFEYHKESEDIWLAAVKVEYTSGNIEKARELLEKSLELADTPRIWMKCALFERNLGNRMKEKQILDESLKKYKENDKIWMMRGQIEEQCGDISKSIDFYKDGIKNNQHSIPLWCCGVIVLAKQKKYSQARALLDKAILVNPGVEKFWDMYVQLEQMGENKKTINQILAKGLLECPQSGLLHAKSIDLEEKTKQNSRIKHVLDTLEFESPYVFVAIAKKFWISGKVDTARKYFNRAIKIDKFLGDSWIYCYKFELLNGTFDKQNNILNLCKETKPYKGDLWCLISKNPQNHNLTHEQILKEGSKLIDVYYPKVYLSSYVYAK